MPLRGFIAAAMGAALLVPGARSQAEDDSLNDADRDRAVVGTAKLVEENYVFPEVGRTIAQTLRERLARKAYAGLDGPSLAMTLTRELRDISHDLHLRVSYSSETLPPEPEGNPSTPPPEEMAAFRKYMSRDNFGFKKVEILDGNIGYVRLDVFAPPEFTADLCAAAMNFVAETDALILDLRFNGGSMHKDAVPLLCSYFFDKPVHINDFYWRNGDRTEEAWTLADVPGKKYLNKPVYVLIGRRTFSGAEEFAYDLQNLKRATIVGDVSGGGANPGGDRRVDDHFSAWIPTGRAINPISKTNWEGTGVKPDLAVASVKALVAARIAALREIQKHAEDGPHKEMIQGAIASAERDNTLFKAVEFRLKGYPKAREVYLAGDFNGWSDRAHPLTRQGDEWVAEVEVERGRLSYKFLVDGEWILDPSNPQTQPQGRHTNSLRTID